MVNDIVGVDQDVAESNDSRRIRQCVCDLAIDFRKTVDCFADDFKLSLDRTTQEGISIVVGE